jgi:hypothetical protein
MTGPYGHLLVLGGNARDMAAIVSGLNC